MININKYDCCGCFACLQACPKHCISISTDKEGFDYPKADESLCVDCGVCEKSCPIINNSDKRQPLKVLAAKNKDKQVVAKSSSGGIFYSIATNVLEQGGVVFGARFDENWMVVHDYTESFSGLEPFLTSKYVQSSIGSSYSKVREFLRQGRIVLFSGTPCQVAGLHSYLKKHYDNLLTLDFLCHGVPSPLVWKKYLNRETSILEKKLKSDNEDSNLSIKKINFRDKTDGWRKFRLSIFFSKSKFNKDIVVSSVNRENSYMKGFLNDLYLRPSCYNCRFKRFQSKSDITIADFWAISRVDLEFYEPDGVSMIFLNTTHANNFINKDEIHSIETKFEDTLSNKGLHENTPKHPKRDYFFSKVETATDISNLIDKCVDPPFYIVVLNKVKRKIKSFIING